MPMVPNQAKLVTRNAITQLFVGAALEMQYQEEIALSPQAQITREQFFENYMHEECECDECTYQDEQMQAYHDHMSENYPYPMTV